MMVGSRRGIITHEEQKEELKIPSCRCSTRSRRQSSSFQRCRNVKCLLLFVVVVIALIPLAVQGQVNNANCDNTWAYCTTGNVESTCFIDAGYGDQTGWTLDFLNVNVQDVTCTALAPANEAENNCNVASQQQRRRGSIIITRNTVTWEFDFNWGAVDVHLYIGSCPVFDGGTFDCNLQDMAANARSNTDFPVLLTVDNSLPLRSDFTVGRQTYFEFFNTDRSDIWIDANGRLYNPFPISTRDDDDAEPDRRRFVVAHARVCQCDKVPQGCTPSDASAPPSRPAPTTVSPTLSPPTVPPTLRPTMQLAPPRTDRPTTTVMPTRAPRTLRPTGPTQFPSTSIEPTLSSLKPTPGIPHSSTIRPTAAPDPCPNNNNCCLGAVIRGCNCGLFVRGDPCWWQTAKPNMDCRRLYKLMQPRPMNNMKQAKKWDKQAKKKKRKFKGFLKRMYKKWCFQQVENGMFPPIEGVDDEDDEEEDDDGGDADAADEAGTDGGAEDDDDDDDDDDLPVDSS